MIGMYRTTPLRITSALTALAAMLAAIFLTGSSASAAEPSVGLGRAGSFAVLAASTVTNTGPSVISGDVGVSPGTAVTGFPPGVVTGGTIYSATDEANGAQADLTAAYNSAAGRATNFSAGTELGGRTLVGGVYTGGALELNGTVTLDAENVSETVWIFQAASTLVTGSASRVTLVNGANPCNVFWQIGSSATLGTGTQLVGTVMAQISITAATAASVEGRLLARTGAVTLDSNRVFLSDCIPASTTTSSVDDSTTTTLEDGTTTTVDDTTTTTVEDSTATTVDDSTTTTAAPDDTTTTTAAPDDTTTTTAASADTTTTTAAPDDITTTTAGPDDTTTTVTITAAQAPTTTLAPTAVTVPDRVAPRAPGSPLTPGTPAAPAAPAAPSSPAAPGAPAAPGTPERLVELPRTGGGVMLTAGIGGLVVFAGVALVRRSRRADASPG
jgi:hypothetical protein